EPGLRRHRVSWPPVSSVEAIDRLLSAAPVHYRQRGEQDDDLARAADQALSTRSADPLVLLYGGSDEAVLTGIEDPVEEVAASLRAGADLVAAVTELAAMIRAEDRMLS